MHNIIAMIFLILLHCVAFIEMNIQRINDMQQSLDSIHSPFDRQNHQILKPIFMMCECIKFQSSVCMCVCVGVNIREAITIYEKMFSYVNISV